MRPEINSLLRLGPLPAEGRASVERIHEIQTLLQSIARPVSDDEARALVSLFGPDDCYGLAWTMLHLIETAPNWPLIDCLEVQGDEWVTSLRDRAARGGLL